MFPLVFPQTAMYNAFLYPKKDNNMQSFHQQNKFVTQHEQIRLFEGDIETDIFNSTYCSIPKEHFDTKMISISYSIKSYRRFNLKLSNTFENKLPRYGQAK